MIFFLGGGWSNQVQNFDEIDGLIVPTNADVAVDDILFDRLTQVANVNLKTLDIRKGIGYPKDCVLCESLTAVNFPNLTALYLSMH